MTVTVAYIKQQYQMIAKDIEEVCQQYGRNAEQIKVLAVTKAWEPQIIENSVKAGLYNVGENYAQELRDKQLLVKNENVAWHYIGSIQPNKVKYIAGKVNLIHTISNLEVAQAISQRCQEVPQPILIQVNISEEQQKSGVLPGAMHAFVEQVLHLPGVVMQGLMTIPAFTADEHESFEQYSQLRQLFDDVKTKFSLGNDFCELSMGMSHDYKIAVACGATWLRLGTILFGQRPLVRWKKQ